MSDLRSISFIRHKLRNIRRQIKDLESADYPDDHAKRTLKDIDSIFENHIGRLDNLPQSTSGVDLSKTIQQICAQVNYDLYQFLPILGFVIRSGNVRNSFEFFDPLQRMATQFLGTSANLVLSTEWDFSPLTYPLVFSELPNHVFIGLPTFESENFLIIPLAGHELGHSIWTKFDIENKISNEVSNIILESFKKHWKSLAQIFKRNNNDIGKLETDIFLAEIRGRCVSVCLSQCQETFCDLIGILVFGISYLHSFEYLLAPNFVIPSALEYPTLENRIKFMIKACTLKQIQSSDRIKNCFSEARPKLNQEMNFIVTRADEGTEEIFGRLLQEADECCATARITIISDEKVDEIYKKFCRGIPAEGRYTLAELINVGWNARLNAELWQGEDLNEDDKLSVLSEIVFKSIEVSEYELKIGVKS